jgi:hypothetical protein
MTKPGWRWTNPYRNAVSRHTDPETRRRSRNRVILGESVGLVLYLLAVWLIPPTTGWIIVLAVIAVVQIPVLIWWLRE